MDFNLKDYQIFKLKKYFKNNDFFLLFHSAKLNLNQWTITEQNLKKLKLNYYKTLNGTTLKTLKNSIYQNITPVISSFVIFINPKFKTTEFDLDSLTKNLKPSFSLISLKLNNKIYSPVQLKGVKSLSYEKNMFNLHKSLDRHLKTSYRVTNKKIISK
jgi:hypothetical protein